MTTPTISATSNDWIFDNSNIPDPHGKGERAVKFIKALKHPKSTAKGRAFQLDYWQERIIRRVYGDTLPDGTRRIKTVFALIPRGNRKTTLGAAIEMLHLVGPERIPRSQCISAAVDRDQARIALEEMTGIIGAHPGLPRQCKFRIRSHELRTVRAVANTGQCLQMRRRHMGGRQYLRWLMNYTHGRKETFGTP
jgi:phage terminase large subunit-like protein